MKRLIIVCVLLWSGQLRAGEDFLKSLTPEELAATGLQKLTPAELARLEAVVQRYKSGEVAVVQQQVVVAQKEAEQKVAVVRQEAQAQVAAAEAGTKQSPARTEEPPGAATAEKKPSWLKALITLDRVAKQPDRNDAFETRIAGDFKGWRRGTVFKLENGQRWQSDSSEDYVTPPAPAPKVRIYPGMLGTFWMEIEGVRPRVRVKPIRLE